ncbi:ras guanine nucleotide exchange factor domain-containing protein [Cladochytrium replicatum]|nr:ras guanine nucleotide exchange factor domain-containing protein [Cladochytrium replicatum]
MATQNRTQRQPGTTTPPTLPRSDSQHLDIMDELRRDLLKPIQSRSASSASLSNIAQNTPPAIAPIGTNYSYQLQKPSSTPKLGSDKSKSLDELLVAHAKPSKQTSLSNGEESDSIADMREQGRTGNVRHHNSALRETMFFKPMTFNVDTRLQNPGGSSVPPSAPFLEAIGDSDPRDEHRNGDAVNSARPSEIVPPTGFSAHKREWSAEFPTLIRAPGPDQEVPTLTRSKAAGQEEYRQNTIHGSLTSLTDQRAPVSKSLPQYQSLGQLQNSVTSLDSRTQHPNRNRLSDTSLAPAPSVVSLTPSAPRHQRKRIGHIFLSIEKMAGIAGMVVPALLEALDVRPGSEEVGVSSSTVAAEKVYGSGIAMNVDPFSIVTEEVAGGRKVVKSAPVLGLVSLLSSEGTVDQTFMIDFLRTYRYFADAVDVARLLIVRYLEFSESLAKSAGTQQQSSKSKGAGGAVSAYFSRKKDDEKGKGKSGTLQSQSSDLGAGVQWDQFLQLRTLNVFKKWVEHHPEDFLHNPPLHEILCLFLDTHVKKDPKRAVFGESLRQNLDSKMSILASGAQNRPRSGSSFLAQGRLSVARDSSSHLHNGRVPPLAIAIPARAEHPSNAEKTTSPLSAATISVPTPPNRTSLLENDPPVRESPEDVNVSAQDGAHLRQTSSQSSLGSDVFSTSTKPDTFGIRRTSRPVSMDGYNVRVSHQSLNLESGGVFSPDRSPGKDHSRTESASSTHSAGDSSITGNIFRRSRTPSVHRILTSGPTPSIAAELEPDFLARQLTIVDQTHFHRVELCELFCQNWNDKTHGNMLAPNLIALIKWFNRASYGVASEVVREHRIRNRVTILKRWIYIAHLCVGWNNFSTVFQIVAGLNVGAVARLKKTWKALPKKYWDVWTILNHLASSEGSYKTYRASLESVRQKSAEAPVMPYLGLTLKDLTFAEDGNQTFLPPECIHVNFQKFRMISGMLEQVSELQRRRYDFAPEEQMQWFLVEGWIVLDDAELYEQSKICEPRLSAAP